MDKNCHFKMVKTALKMTIKNLPQIQKKIHRNSQLAVGKKCTGHFGQNLAFLKLQVGRI